MTLRLDERLTAPGFAPHGDARAAYETHGTSFVSYLARRAAKTRLLRPLKELLDAKRGGGPERAAALTCFAYYAVAASTSYGRGYRQPAFNDATESHERDRETGARIVAVDVGLQREIKAQIRATLPGIGAFLANEQVLGTTVGLRGLGMPAPSRLSFEVDESGRAAGLVAWRGEAIGTIVTELAPTIGGSKVRAYGSLELRGSDGSRGTVRFDREGLLNVEVTDPQGDTLRLHAPLK
jgi:hypothetical protein